MLLLIDLLIKWFMFCCVHLLFGFILLSRYYPFQFVPHWTLIVCSFIFEWRNLLGIWNDAQIFLFLRSVPLFPYSSYYWRCDHFFWPALSGFLKIISSCLCSPVVVQSAMRQVVSHLGAVTNKALSTVLVGRANGPYYCLLG